MIITLQQVIDRLKSAENILITAHINPDGDALGSTLALMQILRSMNKKAQVYIDDKLPKNFSKLPCINEIKRPAENETVSADLFVVLDTALDRIGKVHDMTNAPILNIDHHVTNKNDEGDLYVETDAAATCEIIFKLAHELRIDITTEMAICMYAGIATDTGFFSYSNTKPLTFVAAAELVELGVKPHVMAEQFEKRTFQEVKVTSAALLTTKLYYGGKVAGMFIDAELFKKTDTTEGLIDFIRVIDGVDVAFLLTERAENVCRVSMRSKTVNVADIANKLGGGGHIRAAGCTLNTNFSDAKNILIKEIGEYMLKTKKISETVFNDNKEVALADFEDEEE